MTITPYRIAEFPTPFMLAALGYTLLFFAVKWLAANRRRIAAMTLTVNDGGSTAALFIVGIFSLVRTISDIAPEPQWWSQPLSSAWEISFAAATMLAFLAQWLLLDVSIFFVAVCGIVGCNWLDEPSCASDPDSPTHQQQIGAALVRPWNAFRQRRTRTSIEGGV